MGERLGGVECILMVKGVCPVVRVTSCEKRQVCSEEKHLIRQTQLWLIDLFHPGTSVGIGWHSTFFGLQRRFRCFGVECDVYS